MDNKMEKQSVSTGVQERESGVGRGNIESQSTDRCSDPIHLWRCHLHFMGHLW